VSSSGAHHPLRPNANTFTSFVPTSIDHPNKSTLTIPRVLHTFSSTNSVGKKEKTEVGTEDGEGVEKNPRIPHEYGRTWVGFF